MVEETTSTQDKQITVDVPEDRVPEFYAFYARFLAGRRGRGGRGRGRHGHGCHGRREFRGEREEQGAESAPQSAERTPGEAAQG
ncbi:MAG: hypothetical protein QOD53_2024 [Thermoleophilaceae bacterium]|jgi:hypothetical protein|nr:hypothetical protein [Thermoleophilaceae bacterium]